MHYLSSGAQGPSHCHHGDGRTQPRQENSVTRVTSQLSFGICNGMEMFIWSCFSEASHWIKTSLRVTCGSYLSLQQPDTFLGKRARPKLANRISLRGGSRPASPFLIGSWRWLLWQESVSSLLEVAVTNPDMSDSVSTICFIGTLVGTSHWFDAFWSDLIPLTYTLYIHPKHLIHTYLIINPI